MKHTLVWKASDHVLKQMLSVKGFYVCFDGNEKNLPSSSRPFSTLYFLTCGSEQVFADAKLLERGFYKLLGWGE